jgi:hypothetical protein
MTQQQRDTLEYAHFRLIRVLDLLLLPHTDSIPGIDTARKAVLAAQYAVNNPLDEAAGR